jgi:hypothetical protein
MEKLLPTLARIIKLYIQVGTAGPAPAQRACVCVWVYAVAWSCNVSFLRSAQAERCSIFIIDPESDELVSHVRQRHPPPRRP